MIENATGQSPGFRNEKNRLVTTRGVTEKIGHVGGLPRSAGPAARIRTFRQPPAPPATGRRVAIGDTAPASIGDGPHESGESGQNPEALRGRVGSPVALTNDPTGPDSPANGQNRPLTASGPADGARVGSGGARRAWVRKPKRAGHGSRSGASTTARRSSKR